MTVAVGFNPRPRAPTGRVAERRMKHGWGKSGMGARFKRRSATRARATAGRGLKPTATVNASLRDTCLTASVGSALCDEEARGARP